MILYINTFYILYFSQSMIIIMIAYSTLLEFRYVVKQNKLRINN